jgi:hypothetical protein
VEREELGKRTSIERFFGRVFSLFSPFRLQRLTLVGWTTLLLSQRRADGSWASEGGPARDPYVTVEALRGLIQWAAI